MRRGVANIAPLLGRLILPSHRGGSTSSNASSEKPPARSSPVHWVADGERFQFPDANASGHVESTTESSEPLSSMPFMSSRVPVFESGLPSLQTLHDALPTASDASRDAQSMPEVSDDAEDDG